MACENPLSTRTTAKGRYLDMQINMAGAWKANYNYEVFKTKPDYETRYKSKYPYAPQFEGAVSGTDFTPTASPTWTVDELKDKYAIMFVKADLDALVVDGEPSSDIACLPFTIQKIVSNTATDFTVGTSIESTVTGVIIMDDIWWKLAQLMDYTFDPTANQITSNDADSGGYSTSVNGLKTADITGISGNYFVALHTHFQMMMTRLADTLLYVRHGASKRLHEASYFQTVAVNQFSPLGPTEGDSMLTYTGNLINKEEVEAKIITTEGVAPDFL